jgi:hypothetical protein
LLREALVHFRPNRCGHSADSYLRRRFRHAQANHNAVELVRIRADCDKQGVDPYTHPEYIRVRELVKTDIYQNLVVSEQDKALASQAFRESLR